MRAPLPVYVLFRFTDPAIAPPVEEEETERKLGITIAAALKTQFRYWDFKGSEERQYPLVLASLQKTRSGWDFVITLIPSAAAQQRQISRGVLFEPGDLARFGNHLPIGHSKWDPEIRRALNLLSTDQERDKVLTVLYNTLPIANEITLMVSRVPPGVSAILGLPWDHFNDLASSSFKVECQSPVGDTVLLFSSGTGKGVRYPQATFNGIKVIVRQWRFAGSTEPISNHLNEVPQLRSLAIYLKEICTGCDTSLSIAP